MLLALVINDATGMLQCVEAIAMGTLSFQSSDDLFNRPVILLAMWRDKFLLPPVTVTQRSVGVTGK